MKWTATLCMLMIKKLNLFQFQSLAWISMTIVGLVAFYCNLDFGNMIASYGTITELTLFRLYFQGIRSVKVLPPK